MRALSFPVWPGVSLTLIEDAGQWRFQSWSRHSGRTIASPPEPMCTQHFSSFEDAAEFFRSICPREEA